MIMNSVPNHDGPRNQALHRQELPMIHVSCILVLHCSCMLRSTWSHPTVNQIEDFTTCWNNELKTSVVDLHAFVWVLPNSWISISLVLNAKRGLSQKMPTRDSGGFLDWERRTYSLECMVRHPVFEVSDLTSKGQSGMRLQLFEVSLACMTIDDWDRIMNEDWFNRDFW